MVPRWPQLYQQLMLWQHHWKATELFLRIPFSHWLAMKESQKNLLSCTRFRSLSLWVQLFYYEFSKHITKKLHSSVAGTLNTIFSLKYTFHNRCGLLIFQSDLCWHNMLWVTLIMQPVSLHWLFGSWSPGQSWNMGNAHTVHQLLGQKRHFAYFQWTFLLVFLSIILF